MNATLTRSLVAGCIATAVIATIPALAQSAAKELRYVRGTAGYQADKTAAFKPLFGRIILADEAFAITRAASNADVVLPDSSEVALGASTTIQVGAFNNATAVTPTIVSVNDGAIRFAIRHPAGGISNYRFSTPTSQTAVRGTLALMSHSPVNGDVYVCLDCTPNDFATTVPATGQTVPLLTGQTLTISLAGVAHVTPTTPADLIPFTAAGLNAGTVSLSGFAAGIEDRARTGTSGTNGVNAGGAIAGAAAAAAIGVVSTMNGSTNPTSAPFNPTVGNFPTPTPSPVPTTAPTTTPTTAPTTIPTTAPTTAPTPGATATPSTAPITVITNGGKRATPSPATPAAAPAIEPPTGIGGGRSRGGH